MKALKSGKYISLSGIDDPWMSEGFSKKIKWQKENLFYLHMFNELRSDKYHWLQHLLLPFLTVAPDEYVWSLYKNFREQEATRPEGPMTDFEEGQFVAMCYEIAMMSNRIDLLMAYAKLPGAVGDVMDAEAHEKGQVADLHYQVNKLLHDASIVIETLEKELVSEKCIYVGDEKSFAEATLTSLKTFHSCLPDAIESIQTCPNSVRDFLDSLTHFSRECLTSVKLASTVVGKNVVELHDVGAHEYLQFWAAKDEELKNRTGYYFPTLDLYDKIYSLRTLPRR